MDEGNELMSSLISSGQKCSHHSRIIILPKDNVGNFSFFKKIEKWILTMKKKKEISGRKI